MAINVFQKTFGSAKPRRSGRIFTYLIAAMAVISTASAYAEEFGGIEFPQGVSSFADAVIEFDPLHSGGPGPTDTNFTDSSEALGAPDFSSPNGSVSLGRGGLIELQFIDNVLTNSGDSTLDIHVFEIGPDVEDTFVAIRPIPETAALLDAATFDADSDGFFEIGKVFGSTDSIDIDAIFPAAAAGTYKFDAVQLIDDFNEGSSSGSTVGADIDAVGAITSTRNPLIPTPAALPAGLALMGWLGLRRRPRA